MFARGMKKCEIVRRLQVAESTLRGWLKDVQLTKVVKPVLEPRKVFKLDLPKDEESRKKEFMEALGLVSQKDLEALKNLRRSRREPVKPKHLNDYARK